MPDLQLPPEVVDALNVAVADIATSDAAQGEYDSAKTNTNTIQAQADGMVTAAKQSEQQKLDSLQAAQQKQAASSAAAILAVQKALRVPMSEKHMGVLNKLAGRA